MTAVRTPAGGLTDAGLTRSANEDGLLIEPPLYAVADGMGGHRAGEIASRVALRALMRNAPRVADSKALARAVRAANRAVMEAAEQSRTRAGMGTTLTAALVDGTRVAIAHVGDSRAYLLHDGVLERLTEDHSLVGDLLRGGMLTEEEARLHPQRSVITRALGSDPGMVADVLDLDGEPGDRLLLCTDGLTGMLNDDYISEILQAESDPDAAARTLVDAANRAGGYDNITVAVVDLTDTPSRDHAVRRGSAASGRRAAARLLWLLAAAALVGLTVWGAHAYADSRAYLIDEGGVVTVYRGVPGTFAGIALHWRVRATDIATADLPAPVSARLKDGLTFDGVDAALRRVEELRASIPATGSADATVTPSP